MSTFTNGYKDLEVGFGPYIPIIYTYEGKKYKEGYNFTLDQIIVPSKLVEIGTLVCKDSKKRLVQTKTRVIKSMKDPRGGWNGGPEQWYESYEGTWQEKMKKECWEIQLEKFKVSDTGMSFYYDTSIGFPIAILSEEPSSEYFYSWTVLRPFLMPSSPISTLVK